MSSTLRIRIQGREYSLLTQQSEEETQRVVVFVEQLLAETAASRSVDTRDLTVLALLNLAGQFLRLQEEHEQKAAELESRLQRMIDLLDDAGECG
ncbi:MAG: hypothetical protein C0621_04135 [Desulfuromonas sp.]|nr:MAG: hypothetical protein C0621_04135 [Desulfuromonas sp.]